MAAGSRLDRSLTDERTVLHIAAEYAEEETLEMLTEMDIGLVDPDAVNKYGDSAEDFFDYSCPEQYDLDDAEGDRVRQQLEKLMHAQRRRRAQSTGTDTGMANEYGSDYGDEEDEDED